MAMFVRYFLMIIIFEMMALSAFHSDVIDPSQGSYIYNEISSKFEKNNDIKPFTTDIFSVCETLEIIESSEEDNVESLHAFTTTLFFFAGSESILDNPQSFKLIEGIGQKCAKYILYHCIKIPFLN
jgi:hypothetical protein